MDRIQDFLSAMESESAAMENLSGMPIGAVGQMIAKLFSKSKHQKPEGPTLNTGIKKLYWCAYADDVTMEELQSRLKYGAFQDFYISPADALASRLIWGANLALKDNDPSCVVWTKRTAKEYKDATFNIYCIEVDGAYQISKVFGIQAYTSTKEAMKSSSIVGRYKGVDKALAGTNCKYKLKIGEDNDDMKRRQSLIPIVTRISKDAFRKVPDAADFVGFLVEPDERKEFIDLEDDSLCFITVDLYNDVEGNERDYDLENKRWAIFKKFEEALKTGLVKAGVTDYVIEDDFDKWEGCIYLEAKKEEKKLTVEECQAQIRDRIKHGNPAVEATLSDDDTMRERKRFSRSIRGLAKQAIEKVDGASEFMEVHVSNDSVEWFTTLSNDAFDVIEVEVYAGPEGEKFFPYKRNFRLEHRRRQIVKTVEKELQNLMQEAGFQGYNLTDNVDKWAGHVRVSASKS